MDTGSEPRAPTGPFFRKFLATWREATGTTTVSGGTFGASTVFSLTKSQSVWVETILHNFADSADANNSYATLTWGTDGTLYGTAPYGGATGNGAVFALTPQGGGGWEESILCSFPGGAGGGASSAGAIYRCSQSQSGNRASVVIYNLPAFAASYGTRVNDASGALYATTLARTIYGFPGSLGDGPTAGLIWSPQSALYGSTVGWGRPLWARSSR